jgi:hypothetical protein
MVSFLDMDSVKNALAPMEFVVSAIGAIMIFLMVCMIPVTVFGSGSFLGFGNREACVDAPTGAVPFSGNHSGETGGFLRFFDFPWTVIIVSFASLTIGRTLAHAVRTQREIDATV